MSSNVKTNHTIFIFFKTTFYPPTYTKHERICMQKCENDAKKLIRKVTLKMIEKEMFFFLTKKMRF